jgi:Sec1 family
MMVYTSFELTCPKDLLASYDVNSQITGIEEMIAQGADMQAVLRLLCLASITAGGIKAKSLENIKREILQVCSNCHCLYFLAQFMSLVIWL